VDKIVGNVGRDWTLFREVGIRDDANSLLSDLRTENTPRFQRDSDAFKTTLCATAKISATSKTFIYQNFVST
jgi:hypothetical protein